MDMEKKPTLIIMCGPAGSGKDYAIYKDKNSFVYKKREAGAKVVSRDKIRFRLIKENEVHTPKKEEPVFTEFVKQIGDFMNEGYDVIANATHVSRRARKRLRQEVDRYFRRSTRIKYDIIYYVVKRDFETCMAQNAQRSGRENVPESSIRYMCKNFTVPHYEEKEHVISIIVNENGVETILPKEKAGEVD